MSSTTAISMPKIAAASFAGAILEWYDFFVFGTASALVFGPLFFPLGDSFARTMASFATFGVGFLARPIGGIVFGHIGDRNGRKSALVATLLIMGFGTFLIGLLPTYKTGGIWAPALLVLLRIVQGFGLGGEYGGAALLTIEHADEGRRCFWGSLPQAAASGGILLASGIFGLVSRLPDKALMTWGWRIPFLISIVLLTLGLFIRLNVTETPDFQNAQLSESDMRLPLVSLLRNDFRNVVLAFGARLAETASSNIINAFGITYVATQLFINRSVPLKGMLISSFIGIGMCPVFGALADRFGRRLVYVGGAAFMVIFAFPFFVLLGTRTTPLIWLAMILAYNFGPTMMFAVQSTFFSELFRASVRYTGLSIAYQASAIIGGFTPLIATALLKADSGAPWMVAVFLCSISLLSLLSALFVTRDPASADRSGQCEGKDAASGSVFLS